MIEAATVRKIDGEIHIVSRLKVYPVDKDFWIIDSNDKLVLVDESEASKLVGEHPYVIIQSTANISDKIHILEGKPLKKYQSQEDGYTFNVELYRGRPKSITRIFQLINKNKTRDKPGGVTENDPRYRKDWDAHYNGKSYQR